MRSLQLHHSVQNHRLVRQAAARTNAALHHHASRAYIPPLPVFARRPHTVTYAAETSAPGDRRLSPEELEELLPENAEPNLSGRNEGGGYTPSEFVEFSDVELKHEITVHVDAPVSKCYHVWKDRLNYLEWFDMIDELGVTSQDERYAAFYCLYRWGQLPILELFFVTERIEEVENKHIIEESVEGMPLIGAVIFKEEGSGTDVTLRLGYRLPSLLKQFVGPVGVFGDVNDILGENMYMYKQFVETADLEELSKKREAERQEIAVEVQKMVDEHDDVLEEEEDEEDEEEIEEGTDSLDL